MLKKLCLLFIVFISVNILYADKIEEIKNKGLLKAGVKYDFKPFGFISENGTVVGFDVDLIKYIAKKLEVIVKFEQVTSKNRIPMIVSSEIDIAAASMTHKRTRDLAIDFSVSYFFDGQAMLVKKKEKGTSYKDFEKRKVGAIQGSTSGVNFKKIQPNAKVVFFQEYPQAVLALKKGKIDAITTDLVWCVTQANDSRGKFKVLEETLSYEPYAIGIAENQSNFRDFINMAIQDAVIDGTYEKLYMKWFSKKPQRLPEVWPK